MDTFTWNDVMFNNFSIGIMLNHDNLPFYEDKDTRFDCVQEEFMEQELLDTIQQAPRDTRMGLSQFQNKVVWCQMMVLCSM